MENDVIENIVIVGGGSAGWVAAGVIASEFVDSDHKAVSVTLVESPDVKTIGVGEGTWPTMRTTLQKIGLAETEFLKECAASFKQGTKFIGWVTGDDDDSYYHPFTAPAGYAGFNLAPYWLEQKDRVSFVNAVSVQGHLCDRGLAPKQHSTPEYAAVANYAYHLDAGKFAELLKRHCTAKLGVRHVLDHVTCINGGPDQNIQSVSTKNHGDIGGDIFIDCTGFGSMLLGKHFGIPYCEKKSILFNDSALAMQIDYTEHSSPIASQTLSTAQSAGWIWDIGLTTRRGIGYTYSSEHTNDDDAIESLRSYILQSGGMPAEPFEPRKIVFRPGHREKFWHRNCVAVGMSAGFLEPLEASALVLVELAAKMISEELPANHRVMEIVAKRYNEKFLYRWDRIIDFLKLHYVLSRRTDSDFWIDNRRDESIPDSLQELLALWKYQSPGHRDFSQIEEVFSAASYQYILYGMGFETTPRSNARQARNAGKAQQLFIENMKNANKIMANLPTNRELLNQIGQSGLPTANVG
ncbi:MAG: tryptophan 7-halogenase [Woeseia sp.]|nr:tryptophan 7-halogenase [Woeseia sp.]MBT8096366.1 tryptophan 7-halogenase [Woeseia sp.]NNE61456.1 tryptophan 7-halogenase [Woeseia sp.]